MTFPVFLQNALLGQQLWERQMALGDHAEAQVLTFFAVKVDYEYMSQTRRQRDIAASASDLCVLWKGNCIAGGVCTQAMILFQAGEICWMFTPQSWMLCGFNILTSLVKATLKTCVALFD